MWMKETSSRISTNGRVTSARRPLHPYPPPEHTLAPSPSHPHPRRQSQPPCAWARCLGISTNAVKAEALFQNGTLQPLLICPHTRLHLNADGTADGALRLMHAPWPNTMRPGEGRNKTGRRPRCLIPRLLLSVYLHSSICRVRRCCVCLLLQLLRVYI